MAGCRAVPLVVMVVNVQNIIGEDVKIESMLGPFCNIPVKPFSMTSRQIDSGGRSKIGPLV